jgi:hypothetical protein
MTRNMMTERECLAHTREWHAIRRERARIKAARKALRRHIAKLNARAARERRRSRKWLGRGQSSTHYCSGIYLKS